ncbi:MAG: hypothetical protein LBS72_04060 [Oscillospiraceae bacterium]|jgi:hypothetical protein|nr:hypothetical protein [Oscillospiraceae bacterium]
MAIDFDWYFPFNSSGGDRTCDANDFASWFAANQSDGVHPQPSTALMVMAYSGFDISVAPGRCVINGELGRVNEAKILTLDAPTGSQNRIDIVVARLNVEERKIELEVKKGAASASPVPPALQRDADAWEIQLAKITVLYNAASLNGSVIQDTRPDADVCGISAGIATLDAAPFFEQVERQWALLKDQQAQESQAAMNANQGAWDQWFANIQDDLTGDVSGLAARVETIAAKVNGVYYEIYRGNATVPTTAWTALENGLFAASVVNANITDATDAEFYVDPNEYPFLTLLPFALPYAGHATIYAERMPSVDFTGTLKVIGLRANT